MRRFYRRLSYLIVALRCFRPGMQGRIPLSCNASLNQSASYPRSPSSQSTFLARRQGIFADHDTSARSRAAPAGGKPAGRWACHNGDAPWPVPDRADRTEPVGVLGHPRLRLRSARSRQATADRISIWWAGLARAGRIIVYLASKGTTPTTYCSYPLRIVVIPRKGGCQMHCFGRTISCIGGCFDSGLLCRHPSLVWRCGHPDLDIKKEVSKWP